MTSTVRGARTARPTPGGRRGARPSARGRLSAGLAGLTSTLGSSALAPAASPLPTGTPTGAPRFTLRLAPAVRRRAARTPFVVVVVALLGAGLLGLLALNTVLAQGSFRAHELAAEARDLATREEVLTREVEALRAPASLAARATELGMVPGGPPAFLRLSDGAVLGAPVAGEAPAPQPVPSMAGAPSGSTTWTSPSRAASPAPRAGAGRTPAPRPSASAGRPTSTPGGTR